ncbi:MAG: hypothetical protein GTO40_11635 [Deltaproteobacteria bacterium]|nr:hypothetical protein [Deltaproteobacteria bacterium]
MSKLFIGLLVTITLLWGGLYAHGQKMTEIYIPIGQSPGLSGKLSIIGRIDAINAQDQTIVIVDSSGQHTVKITGRTKIWLDKSKLRQSNHRGSFADFQKGLTVEIKYEDPERKAGHDAEWIKVQIM